MSPWIHVVLISLGALTGCGSDNSAGVIGDTPIGEAAPAGGGEACHVDCFTGSRECRDGIVYEVHYGMPCTELGLSICTLGLPVETCERGCALNGEDCLSESHPENLCRVRDPAGANCGTCILTIQEAREIGYYSSVAADLPPDSACSGSSLPHAWERGCGLVRASVIGDTPIRRTSVWDEATGELVYYWDNGRRVDGCVSEMWVGTEPKCDAWSDACSPATEP